MPRRSSPSPLLNLPLLIIILPTIALILLFFALPSFLSLTSHKIRLTNTTVKSSWNSFNVFLVLVALLCGIFARRNDDESTTDEDNTDDINHNISHVVVHNKLGRHAVSNAPWFADDFSDQKIYTSTNNNSSVGGTPTTATSRLKRSSSSYPDLRQGSFWETADDMFRFFDDFEINWYRSPIHHRRHRSEIFEESNVKEIPIDPKPLPSPPPPKSSAPPPPPAPPPLPPPTTTKSNHKQKRTYRTVPREVRKSSENESTKIKTSPPTPPPPPPAPLATPAPSKKKHGKNEGKKINATREIKMVLASLYRKKMKKQKTKVLHSNDTLRSPIEPPSFTRPPPSPHPPAPPPPPPPPPSMLHSVFKKNSKSKRIHSFSPPPPLSPPPPPPTTKRSSMHKTQVPPPPPEPPRKRKSSTTGLPPLPTRVNDLHQDNVNNRGQSPLAAMPPPPPPPPLKVPDFQFVLRGDFVEIRSAQSSRCSSPDSEEVDKKSKETVNITDGIGGPPFCPSPDVNIQADTFIARLRDGWRLEKINSLRGNGSVDQGPGTGPMKI